MIIIMIAAVLGHVYTIVTETVCVNFLDGMDSATQPDVSTNWIAAFASSLSVAVLIILVIVSAYLAKLAIRRRTGIIISY